ncbi:DUF3876 domain-containing protein [Dysgonomonas sp. BGC7]|uniref:DUF3876 domain-containing protein n=1 Tax=Dysgonomonas sp. BGC7 TaxID=1658008 RepID=UPI000AF5EA91|nr:DUF3876 domain-containing protein [Dysgonomonas sp. BGC7]
MEKYQNYRSFPTAWLGAWESVNGNPDVYIFQGYNGSYNLLAYHYDKESKREVFPVTKLIRVKMVTPLVWG